MIIKSIHVYSHDGQRRDLNLKPGLNVVTGRSSTGKSALSEIVEYCIGRKSFNVPEGVIREKVSWFAVLYQFKDEQVLVAKPTPGEGYNSGTPAMIKRGADVQIPNFSELTTNVDSDDVSKLLSRLLGIPENRTQVEVYQSRNSFDANIKHTLFYLFQKQTLVANKDQLFYRQNEDQQQQTIKDTFPILFGISSNQQFELSNSLREAKRELRIKSKLLEEAKNTVSTFNAQALSLVAEARTSGVIPQHKDGAPEDAIVLLRSALEWTPAVIPEDEGPQISDIQIVQGELRKKRREILQKIESAERFNKNANGFQFEASEQRDRLDSIQALPKKPGTNEWQWPFTEKNLAMDSPIAAILLAELQSLDKEMEAVVGERPRLEAHLKELRDEAQQLLEDIRAKEIELAAAISTHEVINQLGMRNNAAARVVGRISLFLENLSSSNEIALLEAAYNRQKHKVEELEKLIGAESYSDRLTSALNSIAAIVDSYIKAFGAEFQIYPARFDLANLTVTFDKDKRPVIMSRTGGGENHLAYHLSAILGLHSYAARNSCPIPRFLFIDQPTQVYFPDEKVYQAADGSIAMTEKDADMDAVRRLFSLLLKFTAEDCPGFQIIVTEHANLVDEWFQDALVEPIWSKPPALVPQDWPGPILKIELKKEDDDSKTK